MNRKKILKFVLIIALVAVVVLVVVLCLRGNKLVAAPRALAELDTVCEAGSGGGLAGTAGCCE